MSESDRFACRSQRGVMTPPPPQLFANFFLQLFDVVTFSQGVSAHYVALLSQCSNDRYNKLWRGALSQCGNDR